MTATVNDIYGFIREIAPFETAADFDNVGILVGKSSAPVQKILVALDATMDVVREAKEIGADLIVTHHPLLFHARKTLTEDDPEGMILCEMVRSHLSLLSAHTNLDQTEYSGSACCGRLLQLKNLRKAGDYLFLGELDVPMTAKELNAVLSDALHFPVRRYGNESRLIRTLAIAGGADDEDWQLAKESGAQALLTGEVRHHNALAAVMSEFVLFDGGHYATEAPLVPVLAEYLQNRLNDVKCNVRVFPSQCAPFGCV